MNIPLAIASATYGSNTAVSLVHVVLNDNTKAAIYLSDGSPRTQLHDLLDTWLAAGNTITPAEQ